METRKVEVIKDKGRKQSLYLNLKSEVGKWRPGWLPAGPRWLRMAQLLSGVFPEGESRGSRGKY